MDATVATDLLDKRPLPTHQQEYLETRGHNWDNKGDESENSSTDDKSDNNESKS